MKYCTPEQAGISSRSVLNFFRDLDRFHLSTHAVILSRGYEVFAECYYAPFHADFMHRLYSTSKSFVSVAIGFCVQDGLVELDAPVADYFPDYREKPHPPTATVRQMLMMKTGDEHVFNWFRCRAEDRVALYFEHAANKYPNTLFYYDSNASFILAALVRNVTGKDFLDYLKDKVLREIGFSEESYCLKCPGGHAWGDSGVMASVRDMWLFARFVLNGGSWNGKQYLNAEYIRQAISPLANTNPYGFYDLHEKNGYGYQFWGVGIDGCFSTLGMGGQLTLCDPKHDFVFAIQADNQGNDIATEQVFGLLQKHVLEALNDGEPLPEDPEAYAALQEYLRSRRLFSLTGNRTSPFSKQIDGKTFVCDKSATGIRWFRLRFAEGGGVLEYENAQGEKHMPFGFGCNVFEKFPQEGYSDLVGSQTAVGNRYDAAFSADWPEEQILRVRVQIIDKYFGNLSILFGFCDADHVTVRFTKKAEDFLNEYEGLVNARACED